MLGYESHHSLHSGTEVKNVYSCTGIEWHLIHQWDSLLLKNPSFPAAVFLFVSVFGVHE